MLRASVNLPSSVFARASHPHSFVGGEQISSVRCAHPRGVSAWYNAYDTRDVVALYPLDADDFPVQPAITNYGKVRKHRRLPPVKLPNASAAFIDLRKLRDYSLSGTHPEGKHKARVFFAALGIGAEDAEWLRIELLAAAAREECTIGQLSAYGQRYSVEFTLRKNEREPRVSSAWIVRTGEGFPRLISCYVI